MERQIVETQESKQRSKHRGNKLTMHEPTTHYNTKWQSLRLTTLLYILYSTSINLLCHSTLYLKVKRERLSSQGPTFPWPEAPAISLALISIPTQPAVRSDDGFESGEKK